ncbi:LemA family protein [Candidatus Woesebacteria bacterium]|nr:LemA family protein [Candidatus Woesebacteria bacterium]
MLTSPLILVIVAIAIAFYVIGLFNTLQRLRTQIAAAIQEIGNQLKRQSSLIPSLMESVKGYMKHEKDIFGMLTDARKSIAHASETGAAKDIDTAISQLQSVIPQISVMVESNPELKADTTVTRFMQELSDTADKLMYARRTVIDLTQNYNEKLVMFPSNIIAGMFGFTPEKGLEMPVSGSHLSVSEKEMEDPKVEL